MADAILTRIGDTEDTMTQPYDLTAAQAAAEIADRRLSAVELMRSLLEGAEALESELRLWVTLDLDAALAAAEESQRELDAAGPRGPLHGVPFGVKDIFHTAGMRTTACSPIYADFVPDADADSVARLRAAGAVVMGKTVTTQFAWADPSPTRNPWNPARTPGGSSSGSAAGVAARAFPFALGSQTGGSVLRPASYNGVVGLKPTFGRISRRGVFAVAESLDTMGHFARTVEDAAIVLGVMAGHDPLDHASSTSPVPDYRAALNERTAAPRIGLVAGFYKERSTSEVWEHTQAAARALESAGAIVEDARVAFDFEELLSAHGVIMRSEAADVHRLDFETRPQDYAPKIRVLLEEGNALTAREYVRAKRAQREFRRAMAGAAEGFDVLLTPTTATPAQEDLTTTGDPMFQSPWTTCGFPTVTIPSGLSECGMPLGLQLGATPFAEARLLWVARWCEEALGVDLRPPV